MKADSVIIEIIEKHLEKCYSSTTVIGLVEKSTSDYDRGVVAGKIEALTALMTDIASSSNEENN